MSANPKRGGGGLSRGLARALTSRRRWKEGGGVGTSEGNVRPHDDGLSIIYVSGRLSGDGRLLLGKRCEVLCLREEIERLLQLTIDLGVDLVSLFQAEQPGDDRLLDLAPEPVLELLDVGRRPLELAGREEVLELLQNRGRHLERALDSLVLRVVLHREVEEDAGALELVHERRGRIGHDDVGMNSPATVNRAAAIGTADVLREVEKLFVALVVGKIVLE